MTRLLRSPLFIACVASTITAVVVGGIAWAVQSPVDSNGVIHACYNPSNGNLQLNVKGHLPDERQQDADHLERHWSPRRSGRPRCPRSAGSAGKPRCARSARTLG